MTQNLQNPYLIMNFLLIIFQFAAECVKEYGLAQVQIWRRSYDIPPPQMELSHPYYQDIVRNSVYQVGNNMC